jgi:GWxTD domain-containing protein
MKRSLLFFLLLPALQFRLMAFEAFMVTGRYYAPETGSYVETDMLIPATGIKFIKNNNGKYQGFVEITLIYKKNNEIVAFDKYLLNSMEIDDSNDVKISLIDRKRFSLPAGTYTLEATFKDPNSKDEKFIAETFIIDEHPQSVYVSDVMFVDKFEKSEAQNIFTKSGLQITPYVLNYFPETKNSLAIYAEIYNSNKVSEDSQILVYYSVNKYKTDDVVNNLKRYVKMNTHAVNVLLSEFDIEILPSGNYEVVIDVRNRNNEKLAVKRCFFQRSNPVEELSESRFSHIQIENSFVADFNMEQMIYQLRTINPIVSVNQRKTIKTLVSTNNLALMKQFYLNFWLEKNPTDPQTAWQEHQKLIDQANKSFYTNIGYGFETDRGRIFLQYGSPNQVQVVPYEPGAHPYEIWQYYTTKIGQNNVRFIFMNAERATNNYKLIHSTALGEIYNNQWEQLVHGTFTGGNTPTDDNQKGYRDYFGTRSNIIYNE